jgi:hypothetical protein
MYPIPHLICVAGFVRQSLPALRILLPGKAWGIPQAVPELLLLLVLQPDSLVHRLFKQSHCWPVHPCSAAKALPILRFPPLVGAVNPRTCDRDVCLCFFALCTFFTTGLAFTCTCFSFLNVGTGIALLPLSFHSTHQINTINAAVRVANAIAMVRLLIQLTFNRRNTHNHTRNRVIAW